MSQFARVKLKAHPFTESVIPVKGYNLLKKKYTLIGYEDESGEELNEVQKIMQAKKAEKKSAELAERGEQTDETKNVTAVTATPVDTELEDLREQYKAKFGKAANKNMKAETLKAKINEG